MCLIRKSAFLAVAFAVLSSTAVVATVTPANAGGYGGYYSQGNGYYNYRPTCYYEYYYEYYNYQYVQKRRKVCY